MPALRRTLNPLVSGAMVASGLAFLSVAGPVPAASADQPTTKVVGVFSANDSSSLLTQGGDVYSWGSNAGGQTGQGGATAVTTVTATPTKVPGLPAGQKVVQYDQGGTGSTSFSLALTDTGDLYAWGNDDNGQLGNGTPLTDSSTPVLVTAAWGADKPALISTAGGAGTVVTQSGAMWQWGDNASGQTGVDNRGAATYGVPVPSPVQHVAMSRTTDKVVQLSGGARVLFARTAAGLVFSWGDQTNGKRADGTATSTQTYDPTFDQVVFPGLGAETIAAIGSGGTSSAAITSTGRVYAWGFAADGRAGSGAETLLTTATAITTTMVDAGDKPASVVMGHTSNNLFLLTQQGHLYTAGSSTAAGLGITDNSDTLVATKITSWPTRAASGDPVVGVGGASSKAYAVTQSGLTYAWGSGAATGGIGTGDTGPVTSPKLLASAPSGTAPTITGADTATGTVGSAFSYTPTATGDPAPTFTSTGTLPAGVTLSASTGALSGTPTTAGTFTPTITATNATSSASKSVTITISDVFTGLAPAISGTATVGQTLTASPGASFAPTSGTTLTYEWQRSPSWAAVGTAATYALTAADQSLALRVKITAVKTGYATSTATSAQTAAVGAGSFTISAPTITGTAQVGGTLTCAPAAGTPGTLSYAWTRGATQVGTGATYTPVVADLASTLTCTVTSVRAGYGDASASAVSGTVTTGSFTIGAPTITGGPARVGQQLTCAAPAGTPGTVSYAWTRGATSLASVATYTPIEADVSSALTCTITSVRAGYADATNQASTAQVVNGTFTIGAPTITGTPKVGVELTCVAPAGPGTATFHWMRGATSLATTATYTPVGGDAGSALTCVITVARPGYDDAGGQVESAAVAPGTFTVAAPTVTGSAAVGEQLTCAAPSGPGTVAYEWRRDGDQLGTGATYVAQPDDLGDAITCRITVSRTGYTDATSQADSDTVEAGTFTVGAPVLTGQPQVGQTLTCAVPAGTPGSAAYVWMRGATQVGTDASYEVQPADLASVLRCVATVTRAGYEDAMSGTDTATVVPGTFTIGVPTITGTAATGSTLTCAAPAGAPGAVSYAWWRGATPVGTGATYDVVAADVGSTLRCETTSVRAGYDDATNQATSDVVALGEFSVDDPTITGQAKVGVPLTCVALAGPGTATYAWRRGATPVASTAGYTPVAADLGATLVCDLTVSRVGYEDATSSADRGPVVAGTFLIAAPVITGTPRVGDTLTCAVASGTPGTVSYSWRIGATEVGSAAAYAVKPGDLEKVLTCVATAQRAGYDDATGQTATGSVVAGTFAIGAPAIDGVAQVGKALTCVTDAAGAVSYAWRIGATEVGSAAAYAVTPDNVGKVLTCVVTVSRAGYVDASAMSDSSAVTPAPAGTYAVVVSGQAQVGRAVTAAVDAPLGATVAWQWFANGSPVAGATARTYRTAVAQLGERLTARASVAVAGYQTATSTSPATAPVELAPLGFRLNRTMARSGATIRFTATNLKPGQRWVLRFGNHQLLARGVVAPGAEKVKTEVRMPALENSPRWVMFETFGPHRKRGVSLKVR